MCEFRFFGFELMLNVSVRLLFKIINLNYPDILLADAVPVTSNYGIGNLPSLVKAKAHAKAEEKPLGEDPGWSTQGIAT